MGIYQFISDLGYEFEPVFDSTLRRFTVGDRKDKSGWCIGNVINDPEFKSDIKIMVVGDWATNTKSVWHSKKRLSSYEREVVDKERHMLELKRREKETADNEVAIDKVDYYISNQSSEYHEFRYLVNKKIDKLYGSYFCDTGDKQFITIPLMDLSGKVWSCQRIFDDSSKLFISGGRVKGCFNLIGSLDDDLIYICEGWATGVTIHKATGKSVICAMNTSNMINVAKSLKGKLKCEFKVCADNDAATAKRIGSNPGVDAATLASRELSCSVIKPTFDNDEFTDFNDLEINFGLDAVKKQLEVVDKETEEAVNYPWKWTGFYEIIQTKAGVKELPDYYGLAKYLKNEDHLMTNDSFMYVYSDSQYKYISKLKLKNEIIGLTKRNAKPTELNGFLDIVKGSCYKESDCFTNVDGFLNLSNGVLDIKTGKLLSHNPDLFFKYKLDHDFDAAASCDAWLTYLGRTFGGDQELIDLSAEIFGYVMVGGSPWLHKAFILYGDGRNGKSTYLDMLKYIIGYDNYSAIPIQKLEKPFSAVMADGMLANITGEMTSKDIDSDTFKTAVGGEDVIASHKGMPEFKMKFTAKFISAANKMPHFKDTTIGSYEKLCILPFENYLKADERISDYFDKFLKDEASGVINWALDGYSRLVSRGRLPKVKAVDNMLKVYRTESDSVFRWMNEYLRFDSDYTDEVSPRDFYNDYTLKCMEYGTGSVNSNTFSKRICSEVKKRYGKDAVIRKNDGMWCTNIEKIHKLTSN